MKKRLAAAGLAMGALLFGCSDSSDHHSSPASLTVVPTAAPEGAAGEMRQLTFRVTMTEPQPQPVVIDYDTLAGTASADGDYLQAQGQVEILPGAIEGHISIDVIGDGDDRGDDDHEDGDGSDHQRTSVTPSNMFVGSTMPAPLNRSAHFGRTPVARNRPATLPS